MGREECSTRMAANILAISRKIRDTVLAECTLILCSAMESGEMTDCTEKED